VLRRSFLALIAAAFAAIPSLASAQEVALDKAMADRVLGKADAPITIIEYASMTCPHCARFHKETLPKLKAAYIDTGKVKLVYRDFPFDGLALRAAALARCAPAERYFAVVDTIFQQQENWSRAKDPLASLGNIGKLAGMSQASVDACLKDTKLMDAIAQQRIEGEKTHSVSSTPTFIIGKEKISGAESFETFDKLLKSLPGGA
jgi:protein-disulfide isomerase